MEGFISESAYSYNKKKSNNSLINWKMISRVLSILLLVEMCMFLLCAAVSWVYNEEDTLVFLLTAGINTAASAVLFALSRGAEKKLGKRDGYCIASVAWILFTLFGMLPFYLSGSVDSITNAFFETMSGFTTTGATIMDNIDAQSHGILFWRSFTQWIGGLGIVCFALAILPIFNEGNMRLFSAESIGVTHDKIHPKISIMVKYIWSVYLIITLSVTILLLIGGMDLFDAVCHAFTTAATGGYSTKQASIAYWNSPFIEYVIAIFMILSGVNFSLYFLCLKGKAQKMWRDEELRWYLCSVIVLTMVITGALIGYNNYEPENAFRKALFQVATIHTSCGFGTDDYTLWPPFTWMLLVFAMLAGGCTGSTAGGMKNIRLLMMAKGFRNNFKRLLHPNAVIPVRVNKQPIAPGVVMSAAIFVGFYVFCILVGWTIMLFLGVDFVEAFSTVVSSIGNVGPGLGSYGPAYSWNALPDAAKWLLSFLMLIGRLEMFCVLLLFYPGFWRK